MTMRVKHIAAVRHDDSRGAYDPEQDPRVNGENPPVYCEPANEQHFTIPAELEKHGEYVFAVEPGMLTSAELAQLRLLESIAQSLYRVANELAK